MPDGQNARQARSQDGHEHSASEREQHRAPARFLSLHDLRQVREPPWLIPGLLASDAIASIYGLPGSYKSFIALSIGLSIANGKPFAGLPVNQTPVAYIAGEGSLPGFRKRWEAWNLQFGGSDEARLRYLRSEVALSASESISNLIHLIDSAEAEIGKFGLVIIDTLARAFGQGDENTARDMNVFLEGCQTLIRRKDLAMLLVAHTGKKEKAGIRGSLALTAALDTILHAQKRKFSVTLNVEKQKDIEDGGKFHFQMEKIALLDGVESLVPVYRPDLPAADEGNTGADEEDTKETGKRQTQKPKRTHEIASDKVLALYVGAGSSGLRNSEAEKKATSIGVGKSTFQKIFGELRDAERLKPVGKHWVATPSSSATAPDPSEG